MQNTLKKITRLIEEAKITNPDVYNALRVQGMNRDQIQHIRDPNNRFKMASKYTIPFGAAAVGAVGVDSLLYGVQEDPEFWIPLEIASPILVSGKYKYNQLKKMAEMPQDKIDNLVGEAQKAYKPPYLNKFRNEGSKMVKL
jgi:hypothetical protein